MSLKIRVVDYTTSMPRKLCIMSKSHISNSTIIVFQNKQFSSLQSDASPKGGSLSCKLRGNFNSDISDKRVKCASDCNQNYGSTYGITEVVRLFVVYCSLGLISHCEFQMVDQIHYMA